MEQYRISYDKLFLSGDRHIKYIYNGQEATDLAIDFVYKAIRKVDGVEVFFTTEKDQMFQYNGEEKCYLDEFFKCEIDKDSGYKMMPDEDLMKKSDYEILYEATYGWVWVNENPIGIKMEEVIKILKENFSIFNNSDNKPAQSTAFAMVNIKKGE